MAISIDNGFYLEIDDVTFINQPKQILIFSFIQVFDGYLERQRLQVTWHDIYLSHYDPTILAVFGVRPSIVVGVWFQTAYWSGTLYE
jgi:hypothetical protein